MALTYGFYNSEDGDRKYSAEEMAGFLDGIIYDGVYQAVGEKFNVMPLAGMTITVGSGRAWFEHTWTLNTTKYNLTLEDSDIVFDRIDAVVLEVNKNDRKNYLKIIKGSPALTPLKPGLERSNMINQHAIAYITVHKDATEITASDISYVVGKASGTASNWVISYSYEKDDLVVSHAGHIYKALKHVPEGTELTDTEYWLLFEAAETPLVCSISLSGIPSGGKTGYVLAKNSDESGSVGWYPANRLPYSDWMYPSGIEVEDVVAAFKFKGVANEETALKNCDKSGRTFILVKSPVTTNISWSAMNGIHISGSSLDGQQGYLTCDDLMGMDFITVAIKYANATDGNDHVVHLVSKGIRDVNGYYGAGNRISLYARTGTAARKQNDQGGYDTFKHCTKYPGVFWNDGNNSGYMYTTSVSPTESGGVLTAYTYKHTDSKSMFFNEEPVAMTNLTIPAGQEILGSPLISNNAFVLIGGFPDHPGIITQGSVDIHAVVFYSRKLDNDEIARVHEALLEL